MNCNECFWYASDNSLLKEKKCCNEKSENYNRYISKEDSMERGCSCAESREAVEYRTMTPWEFAVRNYM